MCCDVPETPEHFFLYCPYYNSCRLRFLIDVLAILNKAEIDNPTTFDLTVVKSEINKIQNGKIQTKTKKP